MDAKADISIWKGFLTELLGATWLSFTLKTGRILNGLSMTSRLKDTAQAE